MTQAVWNKMTEAQREAFRDYSGLSPQLKGLEGRRVEVVDDSGFTRRFNVGISTGWRPCHLEIYNRRCLGGGSACQHYKSVRVIR